MSAESKQLFRQSALARLSSPDQLEARLRLGSYRRWLLLALPTLAMLTLMWGLWMLRG